MPSVTEESIIGCLLGTAVGDALGLPCEGLSPRRAARLYPDRGRHHFLFGRGMVSDDTEHACFVAQALIEGGPDPESFQRHLARSLRWWLAGMPAGVGLATLRAILKLWLGVGPRHSGVFSAGNGPAMRSPLLGLAFGGSSKDLCEYVRRSTELTHTDPRAFHGAAAVALAAFHSATAPQVSGRGFEQELAAFLGSGDAVEFLLLVHAAVESAARCESTQSFAASLDLRKGVTGYMYHTVPCVIQTWLRYPENFAPAIVEIISAGGDTDTLAAILGGVIGARTGKEGIPASWVRGIVEWPRSVSWVERLGMALHASLNGQPRAKSVGYFVPGLIPRNAVFLATVLAHGLRRLAPPY